MTVVDNRTPNFDMPLPDPLNGMNVDAVRIKDSIFKIDKVIFESNGSKADLVNGKVPESQLPSYVDDVLEFPDLASCPIPGEEGKIYVAIDTNFTYRWGGSVYVRVGGDELSVATPTKLGGVKIGSGLVIDPDGVLSTAGGGSGSGLPVYGDLSIVPSANGQTAFTVSGGYNPGQLDVFLNGVLLVGNGDDYTATNGTTFTLTTGANTTDLLLVRKWIYLPAAQAVNKTGDTLTGALNDAPQVSVASAGTTNIGLAASNRVTVTGTNSIASFGSVATGVARTVMFAGVLTLTHSAALSLPGGANITTAAGDTAEFESLGAGNWRCNWYTGSSSVIPFKPSGTGAVQTTVQKKLQEFLSPRDFGAAGDGVADDTAKLQATIDAANGRVIDLLGLSYKVTSSLVLPSNTTITNGELNGSTMANGDTLVEAYGSMGSALPMSAISAGASGFVVSDATGIQANDVLYLESGTIFGYGATKNGELIKARAVSGTTVTPFRRVYDYYQSGQQFYRPTMKRHITFRNVRFIGGGNGLNHIAVHANTCEDVVFDHCHSSRFGDRHFQVQRCLNARFTGCHMEHSDDSTGLSYGIVVANGCDNVTITGCTGIDMRHGVTIGAENGVDRHVTVTGNTFNGCTDSPIDTHPQAQFITIAGNVCAASSTLNSQDGLVVQGTDCVVTGNVVTGFDRVGILLQPLCLNSNFGDTTTCTGNVVTNSSAGAVDCYGITYDNQRTGGAARVNISNNTVSVTTAQGYGINFEVNASGSTVTGLVMVGNNVYARRSGIRIFTAANKLLRSGTVSNNVVESIVTAGYDAIEIISTSANYIERLMLSGNSTYGGRYGIGSTNGSRIVANTNLIQSFGTAATNGITSQADNYTT